MEWFEALALLVGSIMFLMALGMPVALAFLAANILGAWIFMGGERGIVGLLNNGWGALTTFALVPIPLFLLMGEVFFQTGLGQRMFSAIDRLLGRLPGRLSYVTVLGGTGFSTLSGSSMGSTALLGSLMVPEMGRRGYKKHMSIGPILGTGGLAIIIPPSALAVLLATLAQIDVGALLIAGVIPGLILAGFYVATIYLQTRLDPEAAPPYDVPPMSGGEKLMAAAARRGADGGADGGDRHHDDQRHRHPVRGRRLRRAGRPDPRRALPLPDLGGDQEIRRGRAARDADGLSDRLRLRDLQPASGLLRRVARADHMGDGLRPRPDRCSW
jgi:hypothetical protein